MTPSNESSAKAVYRVTEWLDPLSRVSTCGGDMRADYWLQFEVERWKNKWDEAWVQMDPQGNIALYTWAGSQLPVDDSDSAKE